MFGENPSFDICRPAGGKIYDDVDALPFVVGLVRLGGRQHKRGKEPKDSTSRYFHFATFFM
jgi:hypothetical protein